MNDRKSQPPDEPYLTSEAVLSPTSPKPLQFPQPTNVPILDQMMDIGFNQIEAHMSDPTMHDTTLRADAWRGPDEQQTEATDYASPFSTGGDAADLSKQVSSTQPEVSADAEVVPHSNETATTNGDDAAQVSSLLNGMTHDTTSFDQSDFAPNADATQAEASSAPESAAAEHAETALTASVAPTQSDELPAGAQPAPFQSAVDVQALLDTLSQNPPATTSEAAVSLNAEGIAATATISPFQSQAQPPIPGAEASSPVSASALGAPPSGLPARPPPQEQPYMNPNYAHSHNLRDYHPHAAHPAVQTHARSTSGDLAGATPAQTASTPTFQQPAANTQAFQQNGQFAANTIATQPMPNFAATQQFTASQPPVETRDFRPNASEAPRAEDTPWTQDIQQKYDHFMEEERRYVNEAQWDQFPNGSRLFVGNLSSEKVTKRDIFHVFHTYGELAQISIKQAYGFVQFLRTEDCQRALVAEQGRQIRDKRIHLEISKPQRPKDTQRNAGRRSRSPDNNNRRNDRRRIASDGRDRGGNGYRTGYRNDYRSPSPFSRGYRERYDDRYHGRRSRSRSPQYGRDRYRGPSPRRGSEDDLPLPRRPPHEVPEVQLITLDQLDRDFLAWVHKSFADRGVRVDTLMINQSRLDEDAVVRRQIVEGVLAVSKLRRQHQDTAKIDLTIFKRTGSADVNFEGYTNLDPNICVELVLRERQIQQAVPTYGNYAVAPTPYGAPRPALPQYGYPPQAAPQVVMPTGYPPGYGQQTPAPYGRPPTGAPQSAPPPHGDPHNLQNLLSTLNQPPANTPHSATATQYSAPAAGYPPMPAQQYGGQQPGYPPQRNQPPQQGQQPNMQDILARLGNYNR